MATVREYFERNRDVGQDWAALIESPYGPHVEPELRIEQNADGSLTVCSSGVSADELSCRDESDLDVDEIIRQWRAIR